MPANITTSIKCLSVMDSDLNKMYGDKVRVRVCGICIQNNSILLVKHTGLGSKGILWSPPGGGLKTHESCKECLIREFKEETGLDIDVGQMLFVNEFIRPPLHAVEIFFLVIPTGGTLKTGIDPELEDYNQIIKEVKFVTFEEIRVMDEEILHNLLLGKPDVKSILNMKGYFKFS